MRDTPWPQLNQSPPDDYVAYAVDDLPLAAAPGTVLAYNNAAVSVLPAIISKAAGRPFLDFAAAEVFSPLGIEHWTWLTDAAGNPYAMAGAGFTAADLARFGELLVRDGRWGDDQLLPPDWVRTIRQPPIPGAKLGLLLMHRWPAGDRSGEASRSRTGTTARRGSICGSIRPLGWSSPG